MPVWDDGVLEAVNSDETGKYLRVTKGAADLVGCCLTRSQLAAIVAWMEDEE